MTEGGTTDNSRPVRSFHRRSSRPASHGARSSSRARCSSSVCTRKPNLSRVALAYGARASRSGLIGRDGETADDAMTAASQAGSDTRLDGPERPCVAWTSVRRAIVVVCQEKRPHLVRFPRPARESKSIVLLRSFQAGSRAAHPKLRNRRSETWLERASHGSLDT